MRGAVPGPITIDRAELLSALRDSSRRFTSALRQVRDPAAVAVGHWSAGDVAVHVAHTFERNLEGAKGNGYPGQTLDDIAGYNEAYLDAHPERDPEACADRIDLLVDEIVTEIGSREPDAMVPWFGGIEIPVITLSGILISECELHGFDVARAEGKSWEIPRRCANLVFDTSAAILPLFVDKDALGSASLRFDIRMRGGSRVHLVFERGALKVEPPEGRADCHISADPAAFLLVSYGRIGRWGPILRGQVFAWGLRPLLSLKLERLLDTP